jgi:WD40 repeat protein
MIARMIAVVALALGMAGGARAADRPLYYDRAITDADLSGRTLRELAIMRNTIFARAGQPFRKKWLHEYFSAQPWYKSKGIVDPRSLSAVDQKNADLLSRYEIGLPREGLDQQLKALLARHAFSHPTALGNGVAFSPDGKQVLIAEKGGLGLFDAASGHPVRNLNLFTSAIGFVAGTLRVVRVSSTSEVETWDVGGARGIERATQVEHVDPDWDRKGVFSANGQRFLVGPSFTWVETGDDGHDEVEQVDDKSVIALDVASGKAVFKQPVDDEHPCLALSPDGKRALVSSSGNVALWDLATGKAIWRHAREGKDVAAVHCTGAAISPDGRVAVTAAPAASLVLDVGTGQVLRKMALPAGAVLAFSPDGARLLAGGAFTAGKPALELWDVRRGQRIRSFAPRDSGERIDAAAWSPDGARALTTGIRGAILWDVASGRVDPAFAGHENWWSRDDQVEAVLLSRALGRKFDAFAELDFERTPFDAPELLDELVPTAQLEGMSRRDLRLLRNMVYARRGRPFRSPLLREYFGKLDWYKADPAYSDARLTAVDRRNVKLIQSAEIAAGGPLNDREQRQEEEVPEA